MDTKYKKGKTVTTADGTVMVTFDGKLHNWDGPAVIPQGDEQLAEYYINGIKMSHQEWKKALRGRIGLPWYKGGATVRF